MVLVVHLRSLCELIFVHTRNLMGFYFREVIYFLIYFRRPLTSVFTLCFCVTDMVLSADVSIYWKLCFLHKKLGGFLFSRRYEVPHPSTSDFTPMYLCDDMVLVADVRLCCEPSFANKRKLVVCYFCDVMRFPVP